MGGLRCAQCGEEHEELEPAFHRPDALFAVPEAERPSRVRESDDLVSIDEHGWFIRGVLPVPVAGRDRPYHWGFWVQVPRASFDEYRRFFHEDPPLDHPGFLGTLANQTALLPPTLGLSVHVHLHQGSGRPSLMLLAEGHPVTALQAAGATEAQVHGWSEAAAGKDDPSADPAPAVPRVTTLQEHGWRVLTPAEAGRELAPQAAPVRPGDEVKVPLGLVTADARGQAEERVEYIWVKVEAVEADGWWSCRLANEPFRPATIRLGSRLWVTAANVLQYPAPTPPPPAEPPPAPVAPPGGLLGRLGRWWSERG